MARRPHVAIVGLGLVGGSLARALTAAGYRVTGIDWPLVVRRALRTRAIARGRHVPRPVLRLTSSCSPPRPPRTSGSSAAWRRWLEPSAS